jgi:hypothetical protein
MAAVTAFFAWVLAWMKANKRPTVAVFLAIAIFSLGKLWPELEDERELLHTIGLLIGVFGTAFSPPFSRARTTVATVHVLPPPKGPAS